MYVLLPESEAVCLYKNPDRECCYCGRLDGQPVHHGTYKSTCQNPDVCQCEIKRLQGGRGSTYQGRCAPKGTVNEANGGCFYGECCWCGKYDGKPVNTGAHRQTCQYPKECHCEIQRSTGYGLDIFEGVCGQEGEVNGL